MTHVFKADGSKLGGTFTGLWGNTNDIINGKIDYKEPFKGYFEKYKEEVHKNRNHIAKYLSKSETPFWRNQ